MMKASKNSLYLSITASIIAVLIAGSSYAEVTYKVKKGDNPYSIAKKFNVNHDDIIKINAIDPHLLKPGTRITIPSQKHANPQKADPHQETTAEGPDPVQENGDDRIQKEEPSFHIVKKGDTISALSKKYSIPARKLMDINNLRSTRLRIGQKIALKRPEVSDYTVRKGDTIWDIAARFDTSPENLMAMNSLETDSLKPGQKILLKRKPEPAEPKPYEAILSQGEEEHESEPIREAPEAPASGLHSRLILFAKKMLDIPYRFGGNSLIGIDCSAYVKKVYSMIGVVLPRSAREQFNEGTPIDVDNLSSGDLVFFRTYASYPSHVGIYLGNNLFIHASSKKKKVTIDRLDTPFYVKRFIGAKRLLDLSANNQEPGKEG